jgi:hypothetical protein
MSGNSLSALKRFVAFAFDNRDLQLRSLTS